MFVNRSYRLMCARANEIQQLWKPDVGDYILAKASYCYDDARCTNEKLCDDCILNDNIFIISSDHKASESIGGTHWFFGASLCNRDGGCLMNDTYSMVMTLDGNTSDFAKHDVYPKSNFLWIPTQQQLQQYEKKNYLIGDIDLLNEFTEFINTSKISNKDLYDTNEFWITYVMFKKFKKQWNERLNSWESIT